MGSKFLRFVHCLHSFGSKVLCCQFWFFFFLCCGHLVFSSSSFALFLSLFLLNFLICTHRLGPIWLANVQFFLVWFCTSCSLFLTRCKPSDAASSKLFVSIFCHVTLIPLCFLPCRFSLLQTL